MGRTVMAISERTSELGRVLQVVGDAVGLVIEYLDREAGQPQDRRGGYFCLMPDIPEAPPIVHALIGRVSTGSRSPRLSIEKDVRLVSNPGHISSYQTRGDMYGGAIRTKASGIFAFSGLSEHGDEAAMLLAAVKLDAISEEDIRVITRLSGNKLMTDIVSYLQQRECWNAGGWVVPSDSGYRVPPGTGT